ncbi:MULTISPECIES: hypothetical protein [Nitrosomonas]|uniref:hypothetical protein n=1 Tax=Nitrosomonas TaxID=914 RepID=UPI00130EC628|nr:MULTISPECIES: hypothetical protein [Nitrosomonas]UVS62403.1 hypothetical protein NX761_04515 [Nitrosomonas sp. PLL12]
MANLIYGCDRSYSISEAEFAANFISTSNLTRRRAADSINNMASKSGQNPV